jgi:protein-S-isoprenylcysteine O-methyltransferase Ste14
VRLADPLVLTTLGVWVALELALRVRDARRGKGGTALDRGTRRLTVLAIAAAVALASVLARPLRDDRALAPGQGGGALIAVGLAIMWAGLLLRVWAIASLGAAFRTTVEIDEDQRLVDRGPYRWVRHPSYTGLMLITSGYGVVSATWPSLAAAIALPLVVLARRIQIEEQALVASMGDSYRHYQARTKRLIPGIW